jgi:drug/metabolite transporter (DMT)-like permease
MFSRLHPTYKGILLALAGYTAFSCADTGVKFLAQYYSIFELQAVENAFAVTVLLLVSPWLGGIKGLFKRENLKIHGVRTVLNFLACCLVTYSFRELPMAMAYTLFFTIPFFTILWAIPIYREKPPVKRLLVIAAGFLGVVIATRPGTESFTIHMLAPLGAAAVISIMFLCGKSLRAPTLLTLALMPLGGVGLISLMFALPDFTLPALKHLPAFAATGMASATGFVCVSAAFRMADSSAVTPMMYVQMVWGIVFGFLIFGDVPAVWMLAGAAVIIASGLYLLLHEHKAAHYGPDHV